MAPKFQRSSARGHLPRHIAVLGELGAMVLRHPQTGAYFAINYRADRILCASTDGRSMFVLTPVIEELVKVQPSRVHTQALKALELHERFVHRAADGLYNCLVPAFRKPRYCGELVIIEYYQQKDLDDNAAGKPVCWVHTFEEEGVGPAPAQLWQVGAQQYLIPPGPYRVTDRGIEFSPN